MKLSWEDVNRIDEIMTEYGVEALQSEIPWNSQQFYEEVARRFNAEKSEKQN